MQDACIGELSSAVGVTAAAVMAGRGDEALLRADVPAIHVLDAASKDVDARHKAGHDGAGQRASITAPYFAWILPPIRHGRARRRAGAGLRVNARGLVSAN